MVYRFIKKMRKAKRPVHQKEDTMETVGTSGAVNGRTGGDERNRRASGGACQSPGSPREPGADLLLPKSAPANIADRCGTVRRSRRGETEQWTSCRPRPSFTGGIS